MIETPIWAPDIEKASRDELRHLQDERLRSLVKRVYEHVPFYRKKMDDLGVEPRDIHGVEQIHLLPFTEKQDLRDNYPFGLFAVPQEDIVRVHASSGTTGKPTVAGYTAGDIQVWADLMARSLTCAGVTKKSVVHVSYGYGLFTGGLGAHYGVERIGASVIPVSGGNTERQLTLLEDFKATTLCCTPSYALNIAEAMQKQGITLDRLHLASGVFGAEPWTDGMRCKIEEMLGIKALDVYGLTEIMGPGVSMECVNNQGLHIWEDCFYPEIIDENGNQLPNGQEGEIVFTTILKEGMPLLRYRTHDVTTLDDAPCACGRTHVRMKRVRLRTDDMLIIRGVNVFPSQVEHVLMQIKGVMPYYQIIVDRKQNMDTMEVQVELDSRLISDTVREIEQLKTHISHELAANLLIRAEVKLVQPGSLPRTDGKAKRVIDRRRDEGENSCSKR